MKVSERDLIDAVEEAVKHNCYDIDSVIYVAARIIVKFMKNDKEEIEQFKRLVLTFLSKDTNIEVV